ncbi:MAG: hypothetical protein J6X16_05995 [Bacteroidales bacterium]|nr:hypothetical protein [Bacteroidales bacterium]
MKALKFLGIALLACGLMFTSCKKDDKTANNGNNDQTENPGDGGQTTPDGTTIKFNGTSWTAAAIEAIDFTAESYLTLYIEKTAGCSSQYSDIFVQGFLESVPVTNATYQSTSGDIMNYRDPNYIYTDEDGILGDAGGTYWGWNTVQSSFVENVTAVDLNALTMSANFTANVFDIVDYIAAGGAIPSNLYPLEGTLKNASWSWRATKAVDAKTMSAQVVARVK